MSYYSSETTIETKANAIKVKIWGDRNRDGVVDPALLSAAFSYAKSLIDSALLRLFGESVINVWVVGSLPPLIGHISDDLALYYIAPYSPAIIANFKLASQMLKDLADGTMTLTDTTGLAVGGAISGDVAVTTLTEDEEPIFDDEILDTPPPVAFYSQARTGFNRFTRMR